MIAATYFDGQTTRPQPVTLMMHKGIVAVSGDGISRRLKLSQLEISERLAHAPRIMRLPGGECIEITDPAVNELLTSGGYSDGRVVRWQQRWFVSLLALISLLTLLIAGYQWGLPWVADRLAQHLPPSIEKKIGDEQLRLIDAGFMRPSRLDQREQVRLQRLFSELKQPHDEKTVYRLEFRHSRAGPNAFALPNGMIVMTDQLVTLARSDQAVLAVLAHELGHVHRRHSLRHLMQLLGVGVVINLFIGDISTVLATVPAFVLEQKYSRDFEREADQYAIDMMRANGIPLSPMAGLLEKMRSSQEDHGEGRSDMPNRRSDGKARRQAPPEYVSSHPSDDERISRMRAADKTR